MIAWLKSLTTEADGQTPCVVRIGAALGTLNAFGLTAYDVVVHHAHFDVQSYGIGFGAILGAVGAALKFKPETPAQ